MCLYAEVFSDDYFRSGVTFTTGWVSTFSCFDKDGDFIGKNTEEGGEFPLYTSLCHNVVSCPVAMDMSMTPPCLQGRWPKGHEVSRGNIRPFVRATTGVWPWR
ncbi:unnamed protein product [Ectocarpus sp. 13 AM-2016]